jgi:hypothetical protein
MQGHSGDRSRGKESGRGWARDQAKQPELDRLLHMYRQQASVPTALVMTLRDRCRHLAADIVPGDVAKWPTLSPEWEDETPLWRAGFVEGAFVEVWKELDARETPEPL